LDAFEAIATKLEVREYDAKKPVPMDVKLKVLEAARLTASGMNMQHWRLIFIQDPKSVKQLADDSTTGQWVAACNFAVILLTDPKLPFHQLDAGRAIQDMQIAAWNFGVASRIFSGFNADRMRKDFAIPNNLELTAVAGFGYPAKKVTGKRKNRKPLEEIAFLEKYGNKLDTGKLQ
jgi:nitroreductase